MPDVDAVAVEEAWSGEEALPDAPSIAVPPAPLDPEIVEDAPDEAPLEVDHDPSAEAPDAANALAVVVAWDDAYALVVDVDTYP